jgi:hypothetical protein
MPRQKSPKADNLTNAMATLSTAVDDLVKATNRLNEAFDKKDHKAATAALAEVHLQVLHCKDSSNHTYSHLAELRPKTEPKPKKDKRPNDKQAASEAAKARREERNDKKRGPQRDEASSDEPTDPDAP